MWVCMCRSWVHAVFECGRHVRDLCGDMRGVGVGQVCVVHGAMVQGSGVHIVQDIDRCMHGAVQAVLNRSLSLSLSLSLGTRTDPPSLLA